MKRFLLFILFLTVLIAAEYYFFTELFSEKRLAVLLPSLLIMAVSIFGIFRFAKKTLSQSKQTVHHS
jgi:hypothetical protein